MSVFDGITEKWLPVVGYEGRYEVSDHGRVCSLGTSQRKFPIMLTHAVRKTGKPYQSVGLCKPGQKTEGFLVHRLVALAHIGPPPSDAHEVAHNDGDVTNNQVTNLRWATVQQNSQDRWLHGTMHYGEKNPTAKFTEEQVLAMHEDARTGMSRRGIAQKYGASDSHVCSILNGKNWGHIGIITPVKFDGDAPEQVLLAHRLHSEGLIQEEIGVALGCSKGFVGQILRGEVFKYCNEPTTYRRKKRCKGRHHLAKLHEEDVPKIRTLREEGLTQQQIADRYGVSQATISSILRGEHYRYVDHSDTTHKN